MPVPGMGRGLKPIMFSVCDPSLDELSGVFLGCWRSVSALVLSPASTAGRIRRYPVGRCGGPCTWISPRVPWIRIDGRSGAGE